MLVMLFLLTSFLESGQHDWTWQVYPDVGFKVLSPMELVLEITKVPTPSQEVIYHQYHGGSLQNSEFPYAFVIDYYEITEPLLIENDTNYHEFFEVTVDQILSAVEGSLIYIDYTRHSDRDVCIWRASYLDGKGIIRGNLVIRNNKYYGLQAFGLLQEEDDDVMNKFLSSFHILDPAK